MTRIPSALKILVIIFSIWIDFAYGQNDKKASKDKVANCGCPAIGYVNPGYRYYPKLDDRVKYPGLANITTWRLQGEKKAFDMLFMTNGFFSGDVDNFNANFNIISPRAPIKIDHPDNTFTINLTPCPDPSRDYVLNVNVNYKQKVRDEIRDFDYTTFDNSTLGYVHLFLQLSHKRPDQMIRFAMKNLAEGYDGVKRVNEALAIMNRDYRTALPSVTEKTYRDSLMISALLDSLVSKKLRQELVLADAFIRTDKGVHPPNYDERYRLELLFQNRSPYYASDFFDPRKLRPEYTVYFYTDRSVLELSNKVITQSGQAQKKGVAYNEVWMDITQASFSSESALQMTIKNLCLPSSVIAGTAIAIDFKYGALFTDPSQASREFDYTQFPQFGKSTDSKDPKTGAAIIQYDTLLTRFSGLMVNEAGLKLPAGKAVFILKAQNVIINNRVIAGRISVDVAPKANMVLVKQANGTVKTTNAAVFLAMLKKAGLTYMITRTDSKQLTIYFKKTALK